MVKTLCFQGRGARFDTWSGNWLPGQGTRFLTPQLMPVQPNKKKYFNYLKKKKTEKHQRRSNQSILKGINPEYSLEGLMLKLQ